ncbi:Large extracellular alpha-helical protein [hydrothermal vent metagenome]|uniref:Large extracellular alpha-helical protein n=1 Tax=hydrothermal vent metagenome TaxID=652676 RepID=A0A3B0Y8A4_9ZZZZ
MKKLLVSVFGRFNWSAPVWLQSINTTRKSSPLFFWGIFASLLLSVAAYQYYLTLPKPLTYLASIQSPGLTSNYEGAQPDGLYISFAYDESGMSADQPRPEGQPSIARIDLIGEEIKSGIKLSPVMKGKWEWLNDNSILFIPEKDWPAGTRYSVEFEQEIFTTEAKLTDYQYEFLTPEFSVDISEPEFYQDPTDLSIRRVITTLSFSHPVDKASLLNSVTMSMRPSGSDVNDTAKKYKFDVSYDQNLRQAYIQTEPVALPPEPNYMSIKIKPGIKSILGGAVLVEPQLAKVRVPDVYSFLKINSVETKIIRNKSNEPEQVLMLEFTDNIEKQELIDKLSVYILPERDQKDGSAFWQSAAEVTDKVLENSQKIKLKLIPNEKEFSKNYNFTFDIAENSYLYLKIDSALTSVNKFVHASTFGAILTSPMYPVEINISGEGSVLTYSGEHKLSLLSRGLSSLKYKVGKLLDGQLNHLISQTNGDITSAEFSNWNFNADNIAQYSETIVDINQLHPKKAAYSSMDLSKYLRQFKQGKNNRNEQYGLFFVDIKGWDRKNNNEVYGVGDKRLIMVTDLGLIVKNNADASHDVFVQSIQSGLPVKGAKVELLGKNGIALYQKRTSEKGHVKFPSTRDFTNEQQPTVYVVRNGSDISFIPYDRSSRQINLSKFDIGGVRAQFSQQDALNAYAFTDRGIYRPGEKVNLAFVVKNSDLSNVEGIPLEVVVRGPRNNEVKVSKLSLPEKGMFDFQYKTEQTSDTGYYNVSLHLVRDEKYRGAEIGSTQFVVEEFQPDTMKIKSELLSVKEKGWNTQEKIITEVILKNLFGTPAQDRRVTGRVMIQPAAYYFKGYTAYTFDDPFEGKDNKPLRLDEMLKEQKTDANGLAEFEIDLKRFRSGTYRLQFIAEGYDQAGGRSVVTENAVLISPLNYLLGYKADGKLNYINANSKRSIDFIVIDSELDKINKEDLLFKRLSIQHVSSLIKQPNGTYKYQSIEKEKQIESRALVIPDTHYQYSLDTKTPGDYAIEIFDKEGRRLSRVEYSVVGYANLAGSIDKNAELQLKLNKQDYKVSELIKMNIKAPYAGAGLITIETDKVHAFKWFKTSVESTMQTIRVPKGLEGTAYINVSFVRDVSSKEIFTSPLSYAVKPFSIDKNNRKIDVSLSIKDIVKPGEAMEIAYKASRKSKIIVFAIDEGILQVANYRTPAPLDHFLKKRALEVETLQILDLILPEFNLIKELSASGGGISAEKAIANNLNPFTRTTDKPAVYWSGVQNAGPEQQRLSFNVPDTFAGSLKVFAVAVADDSLGVAADSSIVRGAFVISPDILTQVAAGDEFDVTVGIANILSGSGDNAKIDIKIKTSEHLELIGGVKDSLIIAEGSEGKLTFKVRATSKLGDARLVVTAKHKDESSSRTATLSVRPAMPYHTSLLMGYDKKADINLIQPRVLYSQLATQTVAASSSPLVLVEGLSAYLKNYPHGCTEQVVSKVFPLIGLMSHPAYSAQGAAPLSDKMQSHFSHVIDKLRERQQYDGGFSFWPGGQHTASYPSIYVMHFLIEAHEAGYAVPADMLQRGKDYLLSYAGQSASNLDQARDRANAIYLLTKLSVVTTNYLVDLQEYLQGQYKDNWKSDLAASYMAATYQLLQKQKQANELISGYQLSEGQTQNPPVRYDDFHSLLTRDAQHIYLLSKHFEKRARALPADNILSLTDKIFKGDYNTIAAAYSILALGAYSELTFDSKKVNRLEESVVFTAWLKNNKKQPLEASARPFMTAEYPVGTEKVQIKGDRPLFYLNAQSGFDINLPTEVVRNGIEIHRDFLDKEGNKITTFEQGQEITVRLRVRSMARKHLTNVAITDLLPGGFEVVRGSVSRTAYNWRADYVDVREDRVVYYGDFDNRVKDLTYKVKLTAAGSFVVPPSSVASMYDRSIYGRSKASRFIVTPGQL